MIRHYFTRIVLIIALSLGSCKKDVVLHKITFEVNFLKKPFYVYSNGFEIRVNPSDEQVPPALDMSTNPRKWQYEFNGLREGDKVSFEAKGQLYYHYEMRVYIDEQEVSYLRALSSESNYYQGTVEERRGIQQQKSESEPVIEFIYEN